MDCDHEPKPVSFSVVGTKIIMLIDQTTGLWFKNCQRHKSCCEENQENKSSWNQSRSHKTVYRNTSSIQPSKQCLGEVRRGQSGAIVPHRKPPVYFCYCPYLVHKETEALRNWFAQEHMATVGHNEENMVFITTAWRDICATVCRFLFVCEIATKILTQPCASQLRKWSLEDWARMWKAAGSDQGCGWEVPLRCPVALWP